MTRNILLRYLHGNVFIQLFQSNNSSWPGKPPPSRVPEQLVEVVYRNHKMVHLLVLGLAGMNYWEMSEAFWTVWRCSAPVCSGAGTRISQPWPLVYLVFYQTPGQDGSFFCHFILTLTLRMLVSWLVQLIARMYYQCANRLLAMRRSLSNAPAQMCTCWLY